MSLYYVCGCVPGVSACVYPTLVSAGAREGVCNVTHRDVLRVGEPRAPLAKGLLPVFQFFPLGFKRAEKEGKSEKEIQFCENMFV